MRKYFILAIIACLHLMARGQTMPTLEELGLPSSSFHIKSLRYWLDENETNVTTIDPPYSGLTADVSSLKEGLHSITFQIVGTDGKYYSTSSALFYRTATVAASASETKLRYWFDDATSTVEMDVANGPQLLDAKNLDGGIHVIHYQVVNDGKMGALSSKLFFKPFGGIIEDGNNSITEYKIYLNDEHEAIISETLGNTANPYKILGLLPMPTRPIRSNHFHFQITDNQPAIYAKNDFHIRFYDKRDYFSNGHRTFIDYNVKQELTDIPQINSNEEKTFSRLADNGFAWYKFDAIRGDSLAFCATVPCTIQLFTPSGAELYKAEGYNALQLAGAYATEDGTYYVAVHDVTSNADKITLSYQHIDKYAVISCTPEEIGVTDCVVEMIIDGNGYDKIVNASLAYGNKVIASNDIRAFSKSKALLKFVLDGTEPHGNYDLILNFNEDGQTDNLVCSSKVSLAKPDWGKVKVEVTGWQQMQTAGFPDRAIITVTNTSNMSYSYVPLNIAYDHPDAMDDVQFENFYIPISESAYEEGYSPIIQTENFLGEGIRANVMNLFIRNLKPHETRNFKMVFYSGNVTFNLYTWTGWSLNEALTSDYRISNIPSLTDYYQMRDEWHANGNTRSFTRANIRSVAGIAQNIADTHMTSARLIGNIANGLDHRVDMAVLDAYGISPDDPLYDEIKNLHRMDPPSEIFDDPTSISGILARLWERQQQNSERKNPYPGSRSLAIMHSQDPNDIHGPTSESGSRFLKKDTKEVGYTIEFENDPELATAAAHIIEITDELDTSIFDISTFKARSVKLGNKEITLNDEKSFTKTVDMRPNINVIAQIQLNVNETTGIAKWTISSLDPMTLEPTYKAHQGVLPVNKNGDGIGEVVFDIQLRPGLTDGAEISNMASIVFDAQEAIKTPVWTNTIDGVLPCSSIASVSVEENAANITVTASDTGSLPWKYDIYAQKDGTGEWYLAAGNVDVSTSAKVAIENDHNYGFYAIVTDYAGNVEQKEAINEYALNLGETENISITAASGITTYCGNKSLNFSGVTDFKAYVAVGYNADSQTLWLSRVLYAPAETPLLLIGKQGNYNIPVSSSSTYFYKNMFVGNTGAKISIGETDGNKTNYYLKNGEFLRVNNSSNINTNKCYLQLPTSFAAKNAGGGIEVTIGSSGMTTYCSNIDLDFTNVEGIKAYVATGYDQKIGKLWLTRVLKASAGTALLLVGDSKTYSIPSIGTQAFFENMFVGNLGDRISISETDEEMTNYYLKNGQFLKVYNSANIGKNKCYLQIPSILSLYSTRAYGHNEMKELGIIYNNDILGIQIGNSTEGGKTKINNVEQTEIYEDEYYSLSGKKVLNPDKGVFIKNNTKVLINK